MCGRWDEVDGQTDLWALGATLFTLLTGQYVHEGQTVNETLALAVTQPARSIKTLRGDLPERTASLIDRALCYTKPQRFADARAMQAEVRLAYAALAGGDVTRAAQLSVPDLPAPASAVRIVEETDPRLRQTTARGVSASALPAPLTAALALPRQRPLLLAGGAFVLLLGLVLMARSCGGAESEVAGATPSPSAGHAAAQPVTAPLAQAAEVSSAVPQVSIDELPREHHKKGEPRTSGAGAAMPAKKDDPFARRH